MSIGCDEENFSSPEECCLQPLSFSSPKEFCEQPSLGEGVFLYFIASLEMRCSLKPFATSFLRFTSGRNTMRWLLI